MRQGAQHSVHPTSGTLRVFRQFAWLEAGSDKIALSRPAHLPVTPTVGRLRPIMVVEKEKEDPGAGSL